MLETELGSSTRTTNALSHWAIPPASVTSLKQENCFQFGVYDKFQACKGYSISKQNKVRKQQPKQKERKGGGREKKTLFWAWWKDPSALSVCLSFSAFLSNALSSPGQPWTLNPPTSAFTDACYQHPGFFFLLQWFRCNQMTVSGSYGWLSLSGGHSVTNDHSWYLVTCDAVWQELRALNAALARRLASKLCDMAKLVSNSYLFPWDPS